MLNINNKQIDSMFQVEKDVSFNKILNSLTLDDNNILIICSSIFFSSIISDLYNYVSSETLDKIEINIQSQNTIMEDVIIEYKQKEFNLIFLITPSQVKVLDVPFKGTQVYNIGFKKTQL